MERHVVTAVRAVVLHEGKILLIKRGHPPFRGMWSFPGGRVRRGEEVVGAVVREVKEETGVEVRPLDVIAVYDLHVLGPDGSVKQHFVLLDFLAEYLGGTPKPGGDALDARFVRLEHALRLELTPAARETIKLLKEGAIPRGVRLTTVKAPLA